MSINTKNNNLIDSSLSANDGGINKSLNETENKNGNKQNISNNDINSTQNSNKYKSMKDAKIVKINDTPIIVDIESWKQYNYEQTVDVNLEEYLEEINNNKKENENENDNVKNIKSNKVKTENVTCTCIII